MDQMATNRCGKKIPLFEELGQSSQDSFHYHPPQLWNESWDVCHNSLKSGISKNYKASDLFSNQLITMSQNVVDSNILITNNLKKNTWNIVDECWNDNCSNCQFCSFMVVTRTIFGSSKSQISLNNQSDS